MNDPTVKGKLEIFIFECVFWQGTKLLHVVIGQCDSDKYFSHFLYFTIIVFT